MKIVHVCLCGPMTDGMNYQENLLSKYHKKMGFDVTVIASRWAWGPDGRIKKIERSNYINEDGIKIIRLETWIGDANSRLKKYRGLYKTVKNEKPDLLFVHDCQFLDLIVLARYLRNYKRVVAYVDNHSDSQNSASSWLSKNILHKIVWKYCIWKIEPRVDKFYGVLPARVDFLRSMYKLPAKKCGLLVMGADDELVKNAVSPSNKRNLRQKLDIADEAFLIITGGKINQYRPETLNLMRAVIHSKISDIELLIFGTVDDSMKNEFDNLAQNASIKYVGWIDSSETYNYMAIADLIVFPGLHSVMWEQAVALGIPCVFKHIDGFTHVDLGGNAMFLEKCDEKEIAEVISKIFYDDVLRKKMCSIAESQKKNVFLYSQIAKKSINLGD